MSGLPVTEKQTDYVRGMQRTLHLPDRMLDSHCVKRFGSPFSGLDRGQCSDLIDEMVGWLDVPAQLQREQGQMDMFHDHA